MKKKRHLLILKLINENPISTQEELLELLRLNDFDVTQATVSRDIKELKLIKTTDSEGRYCYCFAQDIAEDESLKYTSILSSSVISVRYACNMVCILCSPGMAQAVCFSIDEIKSENIIGTLAGDDTIFVMCPNENDAKKVSEMIKSIAFKE